MLRLYCGGLYHSGLKMTESGSVDSRITSNIDYPLQFESFAFAKPPMVAAIRRHGERIFLDSGAFTMHRHNRFGSLVKYAKFIAEHADIIEYAAGLDLIGPDQEEWSHRYFNALRRMLECDDLSHRLIPVHHFLDRDHYLPRYLDQGHEYIGLGGMVRQPPKLVRVWLDRMFDKYLTHADGSPKVKVHGFGLTKIDLLFRYPWWSVDSGTWWNVSRTDGLLMDLPGDDGSIEDVRIDFARRTDSPQHYRNLTRKDRQRVDRRLQQLDADWIKDDPELERDFLVKAGVPLEFSPQALGRSFGVRDLGCIEYFRRVMERR
jgi:hypothetical protein